MLLSLPNLPPNPLFLLTLVDTCNPSSSSSSPTFNSRVFLVSRVSNSMHSEKSGEHAIAVKIPSSSSLSSSSSSSSNVDSVGEWLNHEPHVRSSEFPILPRSSSAVNFARSFRIGSGETIDVEQVLQFNRRFTVPALQPQSGRFSHPETSFSDQGGAEQNSIFTSLNDSWGPDIIKSTYLGSWFSNDTFFPGSLPPNLMRNVDFLANSTHTENWFPHMTGSYYHDPVLQAPSTTISQQSLLSFPNRDLYAAELPTRDETIKNQQIDVSRASQTLQISNPLVPSSPTRKRRMVQQRCLDSLSFDITPDGNSNVNFDLLSRRGFQFPVHDGRMGVFEPNTYFRQPFVPSSSEHRTEYLNSADLHGTEVDKGFEVKGLILALQKELRNSDVGNLGRIVLPKKDAEANLPPLSAKEGEILHMEDLDSPITWKFKFRYWPNNKSRMYIMENTGEFVKAHSLRRGDFFIIYKDEASGTFIVRGKKGTGLANSVDMVEWNCKDQNEVERGNSSQLSINREEVPNSQSCIEQSTTLVSTCPKAKLDPLPTSISLDFNREV